MYTRMYGTQCCIRGPGVYEDIRYFGRTTLKMKGTDPVFIYIPILVNKLKYLHLHT